MGLESLVVLIAYRQTLVVPDLPTNFVQLLDDSKNLIPVLVRIADEDERPFLVCKEWRGKHLETLGKQASERLVLVIENVGDIIRCTIVMRVRALDADDRRIRV